MRTLLNIPLPERDAPGARRIIPAEELGEFKVWQIGALDPSAKPTPHPLSIEAPPEQALPDGGVSADVQRALADVEKSAYEEGYRDGLKALEAFKQSRLEAMNAQFSKQLATWLANLDQQWEALEPRLAEAVTQTAVRLARQVLRQEIRTQPEHVLGLAREAVSALSSSAKRLEVLVHPADVSIVEQGLGEVLRGRGGHVLGDTSVTRGGCRVSADIASVDASLELRWAQASQALGVRLALDEEPAQVAA